MKIDKNTLVTLDIRMYDTLGNLLESTEEPLVYLQGHDDIFPKVEEVLNGQEAGYEISLQLEPDDAFGDYDPELVTLVPVGELGDKVEVGLQYEGLPGQDGDDDRMYIVTDVADGMAVLDGNHPLAGQALRFDLKVIAVEQASDEDIANADAQALVPDFLTAGNVEAEEEPDSEDENLLDAPGRRRLH